MGRATEVVGSPHPAKMTTVVRIQRRGGVVVQDCDVYIGRACFRGGWELTQSPFYNPFKVGRDGSIEEVLAKYEAHVRSRPDLVALLPSLRGKRLGCWCKPGPCHGDVLVRMLA